MVRDHPELFSTKAPAPAPKQSPSWSGLPIIFDEVFTGLYRLGRRTSASFLGVHPDVAVNAKLLTGGLVPLCTTVASEEIFDAFSSPEKSDALLHGHSYTAHAVGCTVAVDSLKTMAKLDTDGSWDAYRADWRSSSPATATAEASTPDVWSVWSHGLLQDLSSTKSVESVFAIGTVLSISLRDAAGGGMFFRPQKPIKLTKLTISQATTPMLQRDCSRSLLLAGISSMFTRASSAMFFT